jgi:hypothetical protein
MLLSPSGPFAPPINPEFLVAGLVNDGYYIWEALPGGSRSLERPKGRGNGWQAEPQNLTFAIVNGPSNPELLRAVAWSRQGHTVAFDLGDELLKVVVQERAELATANRMSFAIRGYFASGAVKGKRFEGVYDCGTARGHLLIGKAAVHCP